MHGLLYCALTSHRMNICFIHIRKNAGHWCFGLMIVKYVDGKQSFFDDRTLAESIRTMQFPSSDEVRQGQTTTAIIDELTELDPLEILPVVKAPWQVVSSKTDCYCSRLQGRTRCGICILNDQENVKVTKEEVAEFEEGGEEDDTKMPSLLQGTTRRVLRVIRSPLGNNSSQEDDTKMPSLLQGTTRRVRRSLRSRLGDNSSQEDDAKMPSQPQEKKRRIDAVEEQGGGGGEETDAGNGEAGAAEAARDDESASSVSSGIPCHSGLHI